MSQYARVHSVAMLKQLRSSLATFAETTAIALDEVSSEIQRTLTWLNENRQRYWKTQVRLRQERYVQAKLAVKRKGMFDLALAGVRSSAVDEKKALAIAERQLREAERRLARSRSWVLRIDKELSDYRATIHGLTGALEVDIPNARARLEKMVESLEAYAALAPPEMAGSLDEGSPDSLQPLDSAPTTVLRSSAGPPASEADVQALRQRTPRPDVRQATPLSSGPVDWVTALGLSEALGRAVVESTTDAIQTQPDDKVLLALPRDDPGIIYLERTEGGDGDSGWYIGTGGQSEPAGYKAVSAVELLPQCPHLKDVLNLPVGSLVRLDLDEGTETLFDAHDNRLWQSTDSASSVPRE